MTVSTTPPVAGPFDGNDVTTVFPFTFKVADDDGLRVVFTSALDVESDYTISVDYSISRNTDQNASPGGTVTLIDGALATGTKLTLVRNTEEIQDVDLTNQGAWLPEIMEEALDKSIMRLQELTNEMALTFRVDVSGDTDPDTVVDELITASAAAVAAQAAAEIAETGAEAAEASAAASAEVVEGTKLIWLGAWDNGTTYAVNDAISNGGSSYICILAHTGQEPPSALYWDLLASQGAAGAGTGDMLAANNLSDLASIAAARATLSITAANTPFTPAGNIAATEVQSALAELDSEKQAYDPDIPTTAASQAEMEAGTVTDLRSMTPERVAQAIAALAAGGGVWELLETWTPTAVASKDFTWDESLYSEICIVGEAVSPSADGGLFCRIGYNNGAAFYSGSNDYSGYGCDYDTGWHGIELGTYVPITLLDAGTTLNVDDVDSDQGCSFTIRVYGFGDSNKSPVGIETNAAYTVDSTGTKNRASKFIGFVYDTGSLGRTHDSIRFDWSAGNFRASRGEVFVYGLKRA